MQAYRFAAGHAGTLVIEGKLGCHTIPYCLRRAMFFTRDEIACDPVRLHNDKQQGFYKTPTHPFDIAAEKFAAQGMTVFVLPGRKTTKRYGFAVKLKEGDALIE